MAVTNIHNSYSYHSKSWQKARDCVAGDKEVKSRTVQYVPKPSGMTTDEYTSYLNRVNFTNATARTVDALTGLIFAKDIELETPLQDEQLATITNHNESIYELLQNIASEVITTGRFGVLVDATTADLEQKKNGRVYMSAYKTEDIINWKYTFNKLTLVVLRETIEQNTDDEFTTKMITQYRVLDLVDGVYRQRLFRQIEEGYANVLEVYPTKNGQYFNEIPFICFGVDNLSLEPDKSPILDLAETNLTHFRYDLDRGHALHFVGLPTPYVVGHNKDSNESINLGSSEMLCFPMPDAKLGFLELKGEGLGALKEYILELVDRMAFLGAKLLKEDKNVGETAQAMELRQNSEKAILASIAKTISLGMKYCLQYYCDFLGLPTTNIQCELSTNYGTDRLTAEERKQLMLEWQGNAITYETYFKNMQKANVISKDEEVEDYLSKIEMEKPIMSIMPSKTQNITDNTVNTDTTNQDTQTIQENKNILASLKAKLGLSNG